MSRVRTIPRGPSHTKHGGPPGSYFQIVKASRVPKKPIRWLWDRRIVRGKINSLAGAPGLGKTTILCDVIARLTNGVPLPGEPKDMPKRPVNCWYLTNEDDCDDTLVPLLENHGADMSRVLLTEEDALLNSQGVKKMEEVIRERKIELVVIDSLTSWIPEGTQTNDMSPMSAFLKPFRAMAKRTGSAVLFVRHWAKSATVTKKAQAAIGSVAQTGMIRCELGVFKEKGEMVLDRTKGNFAPPLGRLTYAIVGKSSDQPGKVKWLGEAAVPVTTSKIAACEDWLRPRLPGVPSDIEKAAKEAGFTGWHVRKAKEGLRVETERVGQKSFTWRLPEPERSDLRPEGLENHTRPQVTQLDAPPPA